MNDMTKITNYEKLFGTPHSVIQTLFDNPELNMCLFCSGKPNAGCNDDYCIDLITEFLNQEVTT